MTLSQVLLLVFTMLTFYAAIMVYLEYIRRNKLGEYVDKAYEQALEELAYNIALEACCNNDKECATDIVRQAKLEARTASDIVKIVSRCKDRSREAP